MGYLDIYIYTNNPKLDRIIMCLMIRMGYNPWDIQPDIIQIILISSSNIPIFYGLAS